MRRSWLTTAVVSVVNSLFIAVLVRNWLRTWHALAPTRSFVWTFASAGPVDWFFFLVPVIGLGFELTSSRWSGLVNVIGQLGVFLWQALVMCLAANHVLGFSEPEHVIIGLVAKGIPALLASVLFAWLFARTGRLRPRRTLASKA